MSKTFLIEHKEGGKWLSQLGWVPRKNIALRFPTQFDAEYYRDREYPDHGVVDFNFDDEERRVDAQSDYDPFGIRRP